MADGGAYDSGKAGWWFAGVVVGAQAHERPVVQVQPTAHNLKPYCVADDLQHCNFCWKLEWKGSVYTARNVAS